MTSIGREPHRSAPHVSRAVRCLGIALLLLGTAATSRADDPNGRWSRLRPAIAPWRQSLVDDPSRDRLLLFDATSSPEPGVWALDHRTRIWSELPTTGVGPTGGRALAAFEDPRHDRFVVLDADSHAAWTFDAAGVWKQYVTVGPAVPLDGPMVFDTRRSRVLQFGGYHVAAGGVWALSFGADTARWAAVTAPGDAPPPLIGPLVVYDSRRDRLIVHGGIAYDAPGGELDFYTWFWVLPLDTLVWRRPETEYTQSCRAYPDHNDRVDVLDGAYDEAHDRIVRVARDCSEAIEVSTLSESDGAWRLVSTSGPWPLQRVSPVAWDPVRDRLIVAGTHDAPLYPGDRPQFPAVTLFACGLGAGATWQPIEDAWQVPEARSEHAAALDPETGTLFVTSGRGAASRLADTWTLALGDTVRWTGLDARSAPAARRGATLVTVPGGALLFGGDTTQATNEVVRLNAGAWPAWRLAVAGRGPSPRAHHAAVALPGPYRMLVFGGAGADTTGPCDSDTWLFDASWVSWHAVPTRGGPPPARAGHTMIYDPSRSRVVVFGGEHRFADANGPHRDVLGDVWALSLDDSTWTQLAVAGPRRTGHTAIYDAVRDRMVVVGGVDETGVTTGDVLAYSLAANTWSALAPVAHAPAPRAGHSAVYDARADRMVVFGGATPLDPDPVRDTWILDWGGTALPAVSCDWDGPPFPGGVAVFRASVGSRMGAAQDFRYRLAIAGTTQDGAARIAGGGRDSVRWAVTLPDSLEGDLTATFDADVPAVPLPRHPSVSTFHVPVLVRSSAAALAPDGRVRLAWAIGDAGVSEATVYRSTLGGPWTAVGHASAAGDTLVFTDVPGPDGLATSWRLGFGVSGHEVARGIVTVGNAPHGPGPLLLAWPNPTANGLAVVFQVPRATAVRLSLVDVSGRVALERDFGTLAPGTYTPRIEDASRLPAGIYLLRLACGEVTATRRVCIVR